MADVCFFEGFSSQMSPPDDNPPDDTKVRLKVVENIQQHGRGLVFFGN